MKLSRDEEVFLLHWIYDEAHYAESPGPAKRLQVRHKVIPADLATLIAAAIPDPDDQEAASLGPPPADPPAWPWSEEILRARVAEARAALHTASSPMMPEMDAIYGLINEGEISPETRR